MTKRDYDDINRPLGALKRTPEQHYIDNGKNTVEESVNEILKIDPENITLKTSVSGDTFTDIQTAISSASSGDTIELNGLYKGSGTAIIIDKNNLTIEEVLFNNKYIIIIDGDEYNTWGKMINCGLINTNNLEDLGKNSYFDGDSYDTD